MHNIYVSNALVNACVWHANWHALGRAPGRDLSFVIRLAAQLIASNSQQWGNSYTFAINYSYLNTFWVPPSAHRTQTLSPRRRHVAAACPCALASATRTVEEQAAASNQQCCTCDIHITATSNTHLLHFPLHFKHLYHPRCQSHRWPKQNTCGPTNVSSRQFPSYCN